MLIKRGLKANMALDEIANILGHGVETVSAWLEDNPELRQMAKVLPAMSRLELVEAMQINATENQNATIQKFLAKNWTGMKDDVGSTGGDIKIAVVFQETEKTVYDNEPTVNALEEKKKRSLIDVVIESEKEQV